MTDREREDLVTALRVAIYRVQFPKSMMLSECVEARRLMRDATAEVVREFGKDKVEGSFF